LLLQQRGEGALGEAGRRGAGELLHGLEVGVQAGAAVAEGAAGDNFAPAGGQIADFLEEFRGKFTMRHGRYRLVLAAEGPEEFLSPLYDTRLGVAKLLMASRPPARSREIPWRGDVPYNDSISKAQALRGPVVGNGRPSMSQKLFLRVSGPPVLIGLLLFIACLVGVWYTSRLQRDMAKLISQEVTSQQAALELEIRIRQLRFHSFLNLVDPSNARDEPILRVQREVENALERARQATHNPKELAYIREIRAGFQRYQEEMAALPAELKKLGPRPDLHKLMDAHPVRHVAEPCQDLLQVNKEQMEETVREAESTSRLVRLALLGLGIIAPLSGLLGGYGIARGLNRSILRLSVRVQDIAQRLDRKVASVSIPAGGDIQELDQRLQYIVSRVEEVTRDWHRHQREMLRAEQLAAVGQLAASVAHEVRNPLTSVKLLVEGALRPRHRTPLGEEDLKVIHGEVVKLEQTVQEFLDFARPPALRRSRADLREVVARAVELVRARARQQDVAVEVRCPEERVAADVDGEQLGTVLVNLFLNALDAMPNGGRLEVGLAADSQGGVALQVTDSGPGLPPAVAGRLFTPFFSTKPTGTGLGLSISRRIIEEHGGTIHAENHIDGGACFSITLPVREVNPNNGRSGNEKGGLHADPAGH
jgi:two-component system, NtrC family, sensor histidine kinase HydH